MVSDPVVTRYTGDACKTIEEARRGMLDRPIRDYQTHAYGRWAVVLKSNGKVIGFARLKYLEESGDVDLGFRYFEEYWGQGLATEAALAILNFGLTTLKLSRIIGTADVENKASRRVLEKVGMRFEKVTTDGKQEVAWYVFER